MSFFITQSPRITRRWITRAEGYPNNYSRELAVNVIEEDDAYVFSALVPGLKAEEVNIEILENVVTISGEYKDDENNYLVREIPQGSFSRALRFRTELDAEKAEAKIEDGILTLRVPKAESARPKSIKVLAK